jgi:hypothetical protein
MPLYAVIDDDVVVNTIVADERYAARIRVDHQHVFRLDGPGRQPSIGWKYEGGVLVDPIPSVIDLPPDPTN